MRFIKSMGFPRMYKEAGENRDFLPKLFEDLKEYDIDIFLEEGYGKKMGYKAEDYLKINGKIKFVSHDEVYKNDLIIVLRSPEFEEIKLMNEEAILISMLHYETRETRNSLLKERKIRCFSMDSMCNDDKERIMVNYRGTARSGSRIAFEELKKRTNGFDSIEKTILNVTIIGMGAVAGNSAKSFEEFSDKEFLGKDDSRGVIIHMLPRNITRNYENTKLILEKTDILVDASKRPDPTKIIIPNNLIGYLPEHAVILDLTADPYNDKIEPIQVKGIEGIPTGNLDKYVIEVNDNIYDMGIPKTVNSKNRRVVVSCNAWPGIDAKDCMELYGRQLMPFLDVILIKDAGCLDIKSKNMYERSLVRASLEYYFKNKTN